jgi:hypothetical protein
MVQLPLQPAGYGSLLDRAGGFTTHNLDDVYSAALALWANLQEFVTASGVRWDEDQLVI